MRCDRIVFTGFLALLLAVGAGAQTWNAVTDFSSSNPSGPWSYGHGVTGTSFSLYGVYASDCFAPPAKGVACWSVDPSYPPFVGRNNTGSPICRTSGNLIPGVLLMHPGPSVSPPDDSIVQFEAPEAGTYDIKGSFQILDITPTGVIVFVFNNKSQVLRMTLLGPGIKCEGPNAVGGNVAFHFTVPLAEGDVISFGVNNDGDLDFDTTGFYAQITKVSR